MKNIKKFQSQVKQLADYTPVQPLGLIGAMWTAEEGAEVLKVFKHAIKDKEGKPVRLVLSVEEAIKDKEAVNENDLYDEMADVMLALANLANEWGCDLRDILDLGIERIMEKTGKSLDDEDEKSFEVNEE